MNLSGILSKKKIFLFAPNLDGGGLIFLKLFLANSNLDVYGSILPDHSKSFFPDLRGPNNKFIKKGYFFRLIWEIRLRFLVSNDSFIICGHGLPPIFPLNNKTFIFLQNRILFFRPLISLFSLKRRVFLEIERIILLNLRCNNFCYITFTKSMKKIAKNSFFNSNINLINHSFLFSYNIQNIKKKKEYDFIYPASGEPHKNHINLLKSFEILASRNIYPSLLLIINLQNQPILNEHLLNSIKRFALKIKVTSNIKHSDMPKYYSSASALIFPSLCESLGLPLIEAKKYSLSILASNRDFVFDIVEPDATFNPESPTSIASAIAKHLKRKL